MKNNILPALFIIAISLPLTGQSTAHEINEKLGRGINFGNCFEFSGASGNIIKEAYPGLISAFGFNSVRIPVRWSDWASHTFPYTIESEFMDSVKRVVDWSLENNLMVVLNIHHFDEIFDDPDAYEEMLIYLWAQITEVFQGYSDSLLFEILNEPHANLDAAKWNNMFPAVIDTIRHYNPTRKLVIGPPDWNSAGSVDKLTWPENDTNLILTVHYYNPFEFTHQGASWVDNANEWLGTTWDSTQSQLNAIVNDFSKVSTFSETRDVPVYVGEFGAYSMAGMDSRKKWTAACARTFESLGFSWAYWEFLAGFGVYDPGNAIWINPLLNALTEQTDPGSVPPDPWEVANGDFSNDISGWTLQLTGDQVSATVSAETGIGTFDITQTDGTNWHIQFFQYGIELKQGGTYRYSFDAWSDAPGTQMFTYIGRNSDPWDFYWDGNTPSLPVEPEHYSFDFTMNKATDPNARVVFDFGMETGVIYIDNVKIEPLSLPVMVESIALNNGSGLIDEQEGMLQISVTVLPDDAYNDTVVWEIMSGASLATVNGDGMVRATGSGNGTVTVRATAADGSGVFAETTITISNQDTRVNRDRVLELCAWIHDGVLYYDLPFEGEKGILTFFSAKGEVLIIENLDSTEDRTGNISLSNLNPGIYMVQFVSNKRNAVKKVVCTRH